VIHDVDRAEMGCHHVELTEAGQEDELFKDFPTSFMANMGHHDRVSVLPENGIELAFNQTQPNEAFRIRNKPIYGFIVNWMPTGKESDSFATALFTQNSFTPKSFFNKSCTDYKKPQMWITSCQTSSRSS
jgi:hypothetical protein